jgi:hypothetical protein
MAIRHPCSVADDGEVDELLRGASPHSDAAAGRRRTVGGAGRDQWTGRTLASNLVPLRLFICRVACCQLVAFSFRVRTRKKQLYSMLLEFAWSFCVSQVKKKTVEMTRTVFDPGSQEPRSRKCLRAIIQYLYVSVIVSLNFFIQ